MSKEQERADAIRQLKDANATLQVGNNELVAAQKKIEDAKALMAQSLEVLDSTWEHHKGRPKRTFKVTLPPRSKAK